MTPDLILVGELMLLNSSQTHTIHIKVESHQSLI